MVAEPVYSNSITLSIILLPSSCHSTIILKSGKEKQQTVVSKIIIMNHSKSEMSVKFTQSEDAKQDFFIGFFCSFLLTQQESLNILFSFLS